MPRAEQRSAHLALYRRRPEEAEAILLQGRLVYAAIRLNIDLYRFKRYAVSPELAGQQC